MITMKSLPHEQLAPPGAGLPFPENLIARFLFNLKKHRGSKASLTAKFIEERARIAKLIDGLPSEVLSKRVLIDRPMGLEDSSRYWSVLMTLDHLRIVHHGFKGVIRSLANEQVPNVEINTATVKPSEQVTDVVVGEYEASCDSLLSTIEGVQNFKTQAKLAHPWFGPMNAHAWLFLSGLHMNIHRVQIERILNNSNRTE